MKIRYLTWNKLYAYQEDQINSNTITMLGLGLGRYFDNEWEMMNFEFTTSSFACLKNYRISNNLYTVVQKMA